ncbi:MAG TPA: Sec-independent protein translocase protein TatB [Pseudonocardiaceae bacterium]|jgi:sec-independent protein translocase protein TatB|nr:Sec-independent protein translocase protein TatB [Pseudonocardiaceae bacterium]
MFDIGWADFLVLIIAGLFILGPERLPGAAAWLGKTIRQVRQYASGAQEQLKSELGPEFEELRKPLEDLRGLRNFDPKRAVAKQVWDLTGGYDPREDLKVQLPSLTASKGTNGTNGIKPNGFPAPTTPTTQQPLTPGEQPPFDPDTT